MLLDYIPGIESWGPFTQSCMVVNEEALKPISNYLPIIMKFELLINWKMPNRGTKIPDSDLGHYQKDTDHTFDTQSNTLENWFQILQYKNLLIIGYFRICAVS